jgi:hypothetical protein
VPSKWRAYTHFELICLDVATAICIVLPPDLQVTCDMIRTNLASGSNAEMSIEKLNGPVNKYPWIIIDYNISTILCSECYLIHINLPS